MSSDTGSELSDEDGMIDQDSLWRDENEDELVRRRTQNLGLTKNYCRSWCRADAFREFYQNWRDALVSTFNLDPRAFKPVLKETPGRIAITVHSDVQAGDRMASNKLLGYILFTKKTGVLEMTNFKARLVPSMLNLGGTDKGDNDNLAGCHGEGFKLAALVMCRNGHSVGYTTNSQYWKFRFQGTGPSPTLRCQMSPAKPESVARKRADYMQKERSSSFRRGFTSNLWQDVRVRIGTAKGEEGRQISLPEFRAWLEVVLEIDSPNAAQIVQTGHGDLIVDERFSGRIYLKGLRVSGHSLDGRNYEFGYNYIRGEINRDRDLLTSRNEEALMLARIWEEAIDEKGDAFADRYISLFQDKEKAPDICLADDFAFRHTVRTMWARLRSLHPDTFFYSESKSQESNMTTDCDIITKDFKKTPMMLNKGFWKLLAKHALVRSPYKERAHRFSASTPIPVPGDIFAVNVARGLQGSFQLNPKLQNIRIEFVQAGETEIDLMYTANENRLRIHEKWLDFERVHATSECEYYQLTHDHSVERPVFICDHVVLDLLEIALEEIRGPLGMSQGECVALRSKADKRVRQMPRLVNISASDAGDELCVSWVDSENTVLSEMFNADIMYQVELHSMTTCSEKCRDIVDRQGEVPDGSQVCPCPRQRVPRSMSRASFGNLLCTESYFPMVSRVGACSFFGHPPEPVSPLDAATSAPPLPCSKSPPIMVSTAVYNTASGSDSDTLMCQGSDSGSVSEEPGVFLGAEAGTAAFPSPRTSSTTHRSGQMYRRQESSPTSCAKFLPQGVIEARSRQRLQRDEESWRNWHDEKLPHIFSQLMPYRQVTSTEMETTRSSSEWEPLNSTFVDEYAHVIINDTERSEYVLFVHDFGLNSEESEGGRRYVLVTKYSLLFRTYPFEGLKGSEKELVLHFRSFENMAKRQDAEWLPLDVILAASWLEVDHVVEVPEDIQGHFCRFAIRSAVTATEDMACITPVASHLLSTKQRWRRPKFASSFRPLVLELSPGVLGPSEGFAQAGFPICTALGFDESRHLTWKMRHHSSLVYDGSTAEVMDDFDDINFRLQRLQIARQELPQVVLLASGNRCFRLSEDNQKMASLDEFLKPLQALNEATQHLGGDFIVALLAPAMLHVSTIDRLSSSILNLLEKRMSVHVRLTPLKEHGLPQDRKILTMIASPYCTELPWNADNIELAAGNTRSTVEDAIGDLGFPNPRVPSHTRSGFVCRSPSQMGDNRVYNHYTGQVLEAGQEPIVVEADTILDGFDECKPWIHSVRRDRLTVRELARIQGFPDNFIFYGSMADQYDDIWRAVPPTVTKTVAQLVWQLIEGRGPVKTERLNRRSHPRSHHCPPSSSTPLSTSASTSTRGYKRPRVDSADED